MKKIGFVTPWYGENIPGGAEMELRGIVKHLSAAGVQLEVLTTCVEKFASDWNVNYHKKGLDTIDGIAIRRFPVRKRDVARFDAVNYKLINKIDVSPAEEAVFIEEMINSPKLYEYIRQNDDQYDLFVFIPYMFGTSYYGMSIYPEKSVLIPCLHDESYAYMRIFFQLFSRIRGMVFLSQPERLLAEKIYLMDNVNEIVIGGGVDTDISGNQDDFIKKYGIEAPFILYAGRKDSGKNIHLLIHYFEQYKHRNSNGLKLVLIGGGDISIPDAISGDVVDLGFVSMQDKYDAYTAALLLCQPSINDSFSLVIMESWLCGRPVLVHEGCEVTKDFAKRANGGLYFGNYYDFEGCINYIISNSDIARRMGLLGKEFVRRNFAWDVVVEKYITYFEHICKTQEE